MKNAERQTSKFTVIDKNPRQWTMSGYCVVFTVEHIPPRKVKEARQVRKCPVMDEVYSYYAR